MLVVEDDLYNSRSTKYEIPDWDRVAPWSYFTEWLERQDRIAIDTETTGLQWAGEDHVVGVSVGNRVQQFYLPFRHGEGPNLPESKFRWLIEQIQGRTLYLHNANFDFHMLSKEGLDFETVAFEDTMVLVHMINEEQDNFRLKDLADRWLDGDSSLDEQELHAVAKERISKKLGSRQWKGHMWKLPSAIVEPYASTDAELTWNLRERFIAGVPMFGYDTPTEEDPNGLYLGTIEYLRLLIKMEQRGILVDRERLLLYREEASARAEVILQDLCVMAGKDDFNPNSHVQIKSRFGWASSKEEVLEARAKQGDERAEKLLEYRAYSKVISSYYDTYLEAMDADHVLHPSFQITTKAGRLSCRQPNLQAVPRYNDRQPVKDILVARPGYYLVELDLSQAELRVMAYYADVKGMMETFEAGRDLHSDTAERFGMPRDTAKRINLASVYGIGPAAFARNYGVPEEQAREWLQTYHAGYPEIKRFYRYMMKEAERKHEIILPTGRRVHYVKKERNAYDDRGFNYGEQRASSNFIQGTVAEIMRVAMLRIDSDPYLSDCHLLLTVHDSILAEVPEQRQPGEVIPRMLEHMTDFGDLPLAADAKFGRRWGDMEEYDGTNQESAGLLAGTA